MTTPRSSTPAADADAEPRLLRIQEVAADTGLTPRTIRYYEELGLLAPAGALRGRLPPVRRRGPRAAPVHPRPARRRRLLPRRDRAAARGRGGPCAATARRSARPPTPPSAARSSRTPSPVSTARSRSLRPKIERLEAMIREAEERRATSRATSRTSTPAVSRPTSIPPLAAMPRTTPRSRSVDPPGFRAVVRQRRPRLPASQLPPVLRRPARLARRHLDADGRPGLADPPAHRRPVAAGRRCGDAVDAGHGPRAVRRPDRRRPAQAPDDDRDPGRSR